MVQNKKYSYYPAWVVQTGTDKILHLTKGEKAYFIIADLGYIKPIEYIFQDRIMYYVPNQNQNNKVYQDKIIKTFENPHSTSVASIATGKFIPDEDYQVFGLARQAKVISIAHNYIQYINGFSMTNTILTSVGIDSREYHLGKDYKITNIINLSMGEHLSPLSGHFIPGLMQSILHLLGKGTFANLDKINFENLADNFLLIVSAGNEGRLLLYNDPDASYYEKWFNSIELNKFFPALLKLKSNNILIIGAMTKDYKDLWKNSNYSNKLVDIAAPGEDLPVIAENIKNPIRASGTTYAAAIVSATAELMLSCNPHLTGAEIKKIIIESADIVDEIKNKIVDGKVLNIEKAVKAVCLIDERFNIEKLQMIMNMQDTKQKIIENNNPDDKVDSDNSNQCHNHHNPFIEICFHQDDEL